MFSFLAPAVVMGGKPTLYDMIASVGALSNLRLCLDAGAIASWPGGSGQTWLDISGGGYDWFRGTDGTSQASDPTFNGTPGDLSSNEFWGLDGGDFFSYSTSTPTWQRNFHEDNANFTIFALMYFPRASIGVANGIGGTDGDDNMARGIRFLKRSQGVLQLQVSRANASTALTVNGLNPVPLDQYVPVFLSVNEAGAAGFFGFDDDIETFNATYTSPSATANTYRFQLGAVGNNVFPITNGGRIVAVAMWEGGSKSQAEMKALSAAVRKRFPKTGVQVRSAALAYQAAVASASRTFTTIALDRPLDKKSLIVATLRGNLTALSSATLNGDPAALLGQATGTNTRQAVVAAEFPAGTTDITAVFTLASATASQQSSMELSVVEGYSNPTPHDTAFPAGGADASRNAQIDVPAGGAGLSFSFTGNQPAGAWNNAVQARNYSNTNHGTSSGLFWSASALTNLDVEGLSCRIACSLSWAP